MPCVHCPPVTQPLWETLRYQHVTTLPALLTIPHITTHQTPLTSPPQTTERQHLQIHTHTVSYGDLAVKTPPLHHSARPQSATTRGKAKI